MNPLQLREQVKLLFGKYQAGDDEALFALIEMQRPVLFDYAFRMTGQRDACLKILDEVAVALHGEEASQFFDHETFMVRVFATLRSFASHIWNADTSQLINEGYEDFDYEKLGPYLTDIMVRKIETSLASLPVWEKEPILLKARMGFSPDAIGKIMSSNEQSIREGMNNGYIRLAQVCRIEPTYLDEAIRAIPLHPLAGGSMKSTAALSQIMGDIEQSRSKVSVWKLLLGFVMLAAVLVLGGYLVMNYQELIP